MHLVAGVLAGDVPARKIENHQVSYTVAVQVCQRVQHLSCHVPSGEQGKPVRVECHIGREGLGFRCKQSALILEMNLEVLLVPEHQVAATISVVVDLVDTALRPRVVSISVGSEDPLHLGGGTDLHFLSECTVAHLDKYPEAIGVGHYQVVVTIAVHVVSDIYMGNFAAARRLEVASNRYQHVFRCRLGVKPVQADPART